MENPCKECKLSQAEKSACCGCPQRLKYEKEKVLKDEEWLMYAIIGVIIGFILHYLVIRPLERKRIREECIRDGLVPREYDWFEKIEWFISSWHIKANQTRTIMWFLYICKRRNCYNLSLLVSSILQARKTAEDEEIQNDTISRFVVNY